MTIDTRPPPVTSSRFAEFWKSGDKSLWFPIAVVLAMFMFFSFATDSFATLRNFTAVSGQAGALLLACLGGSFIVLMGSIDLSIGSMVLLSGAISVTLINVSPIGVAVLPAMTLVGGILGLINGLIYVYGRIPSFIVTLGTLSVFGGAALKLLDGRAIQFDLPGFELIAIGQLIPRMPNIALCALLAWVIIVIVGLRTRFGRYMYMIGGGEAVARTAGVPVRRFKIYAFVLSGALAGLAAVISVARLGASGPSLGADLLLNSLAAIVVGGTSLSGGVGGPHRTLIGVLIIAILDNGLNLMSVDQYSQMIVKGIVVIIAVLVSRDANRAEIVK